ncbi:NIPA-like protein 2 [Leucoagaricus sp. SymC.cos]|nr:NIPA-like protein 2 [Leucoagaricus sp. SymC.cos]
MDDLPQLTTQTVIGIAVAISGNVLISLALNLQKLAHKRLDAQNNGQANASGQMRPLLPSRRTPSSGPSLNEQDEDSDTIMEHTTPPQQHSPTLESQPLLPVINHSRNYTTLEREDNLPEIEPQKPGLFRRLFRPKKRLSKKRLAVLPIGVMPETDALRGMESSQTQSEDEGESDQADETAYLKSKLWWTGFFLMNVGELGNFISYAFAPASIVAPLGTFALIANCVFAPLMLGEHFRKRDFLGICVAIVGAVTVVLSSNASDTRLDPRQLVEAIIQTPFLIYTGTYIGGACILAGLSQGRLGRTYVYIDIGLCALFGGFTVLSTKALSILITLEWYGVFTEWITYPLIITLLGTGVGQIKYLNRALMRFDGKAVIPIQFVFFTLSAITGSAILYGDFRKASFHELITFLYGCAATFAGVFILASGATGDHKEHDPHIIQPDEEIEEGTRLGLGTIGKRQHATLVLPSGMAPPRETPSPRRKRSNVGLVGISPAQVRILFQLSRPRKRVDPLHSLVLASTSRTYSAP